MQQISVVLIVRNEEANLAKCINSTKGLADHVIVVDTGSDDNTVKIAAECGARIFNFPWVDDFAAARNYALSLSDTEWNLILDADEYIVDVDPGAVRAFLKQSQAVGRIEIVSETADSEEIYETRNYITRLIPRGLQFKGKIHEQVDTDLPRTNVPIVVRHTGYLHRNKSNRNIPLLQDELLMNADDPYLHYQLAKEYSGIGLYEDSKFSFERAIDLISGNERFAPNIIVDYLYLTIKMQDYERGLEIVNSAYACVQGFSDYFFACGVFYRDLVLSEPTEYVSLLPAIESSYLKCIELGDSLRYDGVTGTGTFAAWYNLGNYYEVLGNTDKARNCYRRSAQYNYARAIQRLHDIA